MINQDCYRYAYNIKYSWENYFLTMANWWTLDSSDKNDSNYSFITLILFRTNTLCFDKLIQNKITKNLRIVRGSHRRKKGACGFIKNDTLAQVLYSEFCEILKNNFFAEHLCATSSVCIFLFAIFQFNKNH